MIDFKLDKFFSDLYGPLAGTKRARRVRRELERFISSVNLEKRPHEMLTTGR